MMSEDHTNHQQTLNYIQEYLNMFELIVWSLFASEQILHQEMLHRDFLTPAKVAWSKNQIDITPEQQ